MTSTLPWLKNAKREMDGYLYVFFIFCQLV